VKKKALIVTLFVAILVTEIATGAVMVKQYFL